MEVQFLSKKVTDEIEDVERRVTIGGMTMAGN